MPPARLALAHPSVLALVALTGLVAAGCLAHERDPGSDGGGLADGGGLGDCGGGPACTAGNQCVCGRCISLDLVPPACDPPCASAAPGDFCTTPGRICPGAGCTELVCTSGTFVSRPSDVCDAGVGTDSGWCECPMPPPGCVYDGVPCGCTHMTCTPMRCGREVCAEGTFCCNSSCNLCTPPGTGCIDIACAPDCSPMDARSNGRCAGSPGYAWDGTACRPLACSCIGTECDAIFGTEGECNAAFGACAPASDCSFDDATGVGACTAVIGVTFGPTGCITISGCECAGTDCATVVGRSQAECEAAHAGCTIAFP